MKSIYNVLPEAKLSTGNTGVNVVETIITDRAPGSVVSDLQTTFTICVTVDKSHIYNNYCHSVHFWINKQYNEAGENKKWKTA